MQQVKWCATPRSAEFIRLGNAGIGDLELLTGHKAINICCERKGTVKTASGTWPGLKPYCRWLIYKLPLEMSYVPYISLWTSDRCPAWQAVLMISLPLFTVTLNKAILVAVNHVAAAISSDKWLYVLSLFIHDGCQQNLQWINFFSLSKNVE